MVIKVEVVHHLLLEVVEEELELLVLIHQVELVELVEMELLHQ